MAEQLANLEKVFSNKYSTSEQIIGIWTDGKPLYRCVISTTTPSNNSDTVVEVLPNTFLVKRIDGEIHQSPNNFMSVNYYYSASNYAATYYQYSPYPGIHMQVYGVSVQGKPCEIIIEYTKTTD